MVLRKFYISVQWKKISNKRVQKRDLLDGNIYSKMHKNNMSYNKQNTKNNIQTGRRPMAPIRLNFTCSGNVNDILTT